MLEWLWKRLGYHVCEEFTQWQDCRGTYTRPTTVELDGMLALDVDQITYSRRWQERSCTICGLIQQRDIRQ